MDLQRHRRLPHIDPVYSLYRHSESGNAPLRIGLLLDSVQLPSCFAEVVDHILQSDFARLELLVLNAEEQKRAAAPPPQRALFRKVSDLLRSRQRRQRLLFELYERWDRRNADANENPHIVVDCSARLEQVASMTVTPIRKRFVHRFPADAIELIREKHLDVLIRFGFNILRGEILTAARCGVWSYHHGDGDYYRGGPSHFWEVYEGNPISGAMLQVLTEELDAGKVLYKGLFATTPGISRMRNCVQPYWGASTFMIQKLRELHQRGWEHVGRTAVCSAPYCGKKKIYSAPSNAEMLRWLGPRLIAGPLRRVVRRPMTEHWRLAVRPGAGLIDSSGPEPDLSGFRWIESPKGRYYADPFMIEERGKSWVFFEDCDYATGRGRITCAEVRKGGITDPAPVLERPYHLSYPCVFRAGDAMYMIPETASNGTVELYRCVRFPDRWDLEKTLFRAQAVDTTLWIDDGSYWFFVTLQESRGYGTQLWLFHANALTGEWTPHPDSPISTDVRNSRGAGGIFRHAGKLFRPSQDCSRHYGYSFTLNEIVACDRYRYQERPGVTVNPRWAGGLVGTHTYSHAGQFEIIDGCARMPDSVVRLPQREVAVARGHAPARSAGFAHNLNG
ncbi:MAG: hypothetical protein ABSH42_04360 [Bryobacteraceae bacterium]|jgi:hypothetical protein